MTDVTLDNLDRRILHLLQVDARNPSDTDIGQETGVTGTTVNNRIKKLETEGVIRGYHPEIDYERAGYPMHVLFICTVDLPDREQYAKDALEVQGVVNIREMLAGEQNLHVEVVAGSTSEIKRSTQELEELGLHIITSNIIAEERIQPWNHFHQELPGEDAETPEEIGEE